MDGKFLQKILYTEADTIAFGQALAPHLKPKDIVKITGPLGAGKTTFVRGIIAGLGGDLAQVHSPTFSISHQYHTASIGVIHCDFYRLPKDSDLAEFGGIEFFDDDFLYLVEWPEQTKVLQSTTPNRLLTVDLQLDAESRIATLMGPWQIVDQNIIGC